MDDFEASRLGSLFTGNGQVPRGLTTIEWNIQTPIWLVPNTCTHRYNVSKLGPPYQSQIKALPHGL